MISVVVCGVCLVGVAPHFMWGTVPPLATPEKELLLSHKTSIVCLLTHSLEPCGSIVLPPLKNLNSPLDIPVGSLSLYAGRVFWWCVDVQQVCLHKEGEGFTTWGGWAFHALSLQCEGGELCLEGAVCEDYYRVRQLLYDQFAII